MEKLILVELSKIIIDEKRQDQIIVLKEKNGTRQFPIVIGFLEASSIQYKLVGLKPPRPLTHDLLACIVEALGAQLKRLIIDKMIKSTFHAKCEFVSKDKKTFVIDARPSDGISLAVRLKAPVYVKEEVLNKAAIF